MERFDLLAALGPLTRALRQVEDEAAGRVDLTMWQYAVLALAVAQPGLNQGDAARRLGYSANRIVADLDVLEQRGLLTRSPGPDRRANQLHATRAGERVMRTVRAAIHRGEDALLAGLDAEQRAALRAATRTLGAGLRRR